MNQYNSNPFSWMKQKFCQSPQIWDPKISRRAIRNSIWYCFIRQISWTSRVRLSSRRFGNFVRFLTSRLWRNLQGEVRSGSATSSPSCRQKMGSQLSMICGNYVTMYGYVFVWVFLPNKFQVPKNAWNFWQFTSKIIISLRFQILFFPQRKYLEKNLERIDPGIGLWWLRQGGFVPWTWWRRMTSSFERQASWWRYTYISLKHDYGRIRVYRIILTVYTIVSQGSMAKKPLPSTVANSKGLW